MVLHKNEFLSQHRQTIPKPTCLGLVFILLHFYWPPNLPLISGSHFTFIVNLISILFFFVFTIFFRLANEMNSRSTKFHLAASEGLFIYCKFVSANEDSEFYETNLYSNRMGHFLQMGLFMGPCSFIPFMCTLFV